MLVLSRKQGESLVLPASNITIKVLRVTSNKVRIGISAPPAIEVHRQEVCDLIQAASPREPSVSRRTRATT